MAGSTAIATVIASLGVLAEVGVATFIFLEWRHSNRAEVSRVTENIFTEWWSDALREHRRYFYQVFLVEDRPKLVASGLGLKDLRPAARFDANDERHRVTQFCYFFDRVGFLGASGLLDVDYVMAPMQHVVRRVWWAVEPLVKRSREADSTYGADPNFLYGFEWLYERTEREGCSQAALMVKRFRKPDLFRHGGVDALAAEIRKAEDTYRNDLRIRELAYRADSERGKDRSESPR